MVDLQAVIEANIIAPLVNLLQTAEFDIKKEAAWAISNATSGGYHDQIKCVYCPDVYVNMLSHIFSVYLDIYHCFVLTQVSSDPGLHQALV